MKLRKRNTGSAFLLVVFIIALLAAVTMGICQMNTEQVQLMRNHVYAAQALAVAEAGLNDAFAEIRTDPNWNSGFTDKAFPAGLGHTYTVTAADGGAGQIIVTSTGRTATGYTKTITATLGGF